MSDFSGVGKPSKPEWKSVRIFWGNNNEKDFNKINPFPELRVPKTDDETVMEFSREVSVCPFEPSKTYSSGLKPVGSVYEEENYDFDKISKKFNKVTNELLYIDNEELKKPDIYIDNITKPRIQEIRKTGRQLEKKRKGIIANAVSQFVIVKIELTVPVLSVDDIPNITSWAFLQPPTIGNNKHRISVNNGYVVDDAQKAGWYKAQLDTSNAQEQTQGLWRADMQVERYQVNNDAQRKQDYKIVTSNTPAWIKIDQDNPKNIWIKYEVVVRNDCTLIDLQERKDAIAKAGSNKDMVTAECGSYLKVWVRNTDHNWSKDPVDEFSESLREAMAEDDYNYDSSNPQKFKNHTWRRSPLLSGKNSSDLLYIGLYPSPLIERLENIEKMMAVQPALDEEAVNYGVWLAMTSLFALFCYALHEVTENSGIDAHTKSDKTKNQEDFIQEKGKMVRNILNLFSAEEFAAALAVVGLPSSSKDMSSILSDCEKEAYKSMYTFTVYIYKQMLDFAVIKDDKSKKDHYEEIDKENEKIEEQQEKYDVSEGISKLKNLLSQKTVDKKTFKDIINDFKKKTKLGVGGEAKFTSSLDLGSLGAAMKMPFPKGMPLPIPFLQWIIWSTEFLVKSGINLDITAAYDETEESEGKSASDKISLDLSFNSNSSASILFSLQSFWTAYIENTDKKYEVKNTASEMHGFYFGEMLQDIAKSAEFNLFVQLSLNTDAKMGPKFEYDFAKEQDAFSVSLGDAGGGLGMLAPAGAHIGIFKWDYKLASAEIVTVTKNEGVFFNKLTFFNNTWNMPQIVRWGKGRLYDYVLLIEPKKQNQYELGDTIKFALPYAEIENVNASKADITVAAGTIKLFNGDDLKSVAFKETIQGRDYSHRQVLSTELRVFNEDDSKVSINKKDGNLISKNISGFIKDLADGNDVEIGASITFKGEKTRNVNAGTGPIMLAPKIIRNDAMYDYGTKSLIFKFNIANFNDDHLWVRFKEKDVISMFDDELKFKSSFSEATEWNCIKLDRSGKNFILRAPLNDFKDIEDEKDSMFAVYAELALAKGDEYIISKEVDLNFVRITSDMLKEIKSNKSLA